MMHTNNALSGNALFGFHRLVTLLHFISL